MTKCVGGRERSGAVDTKNEPIGKDSPMGAHVASEALNLVSFLKHPFGSLGGPESGLVVSRGRRSPYSRQGCVGGRRMAFVSVVLLCSLNFMFKEEPFFRDPDTS